MTTPDRFDYNNRRTMVRHMYYIARANNQDLAHTYGGSTTPIVEFHGNTPGSRTPEWVRSKSGAKQQSLTDDRAKLFIIGCLLDVAWNTNWTTTRTNVASAVSALSV